MISVYIIHPLGNKNIWDISGLSLPLLLRHFINNINHHEVLKKSQEILVVHRIHPLGNVAIMSLKAALLSKGIIIIHRRCLLIVSFFTYHVENPWFNPGRRHKSLWSCGRKAIWCKKKEKKKENLLVQTCEATCCGDPVWVREQLKVTLSDSSSGSHEYMC